MKFQRSFMPALLTLALGALVAPPGCSEQGIGERCDTRSGNTDCETGLECVTWSALLDKSADRCCPAPEESSGACARSGTQPGSGGSAGQDGSAGMSGASAGAAGGSATGGASGAAGSGGAAGMAGAAGAAGSSGGGAGGGTAGAAGGG
jgi:hypothetical protein